MPPDGLFWAEAVPGLSMIARRVRGARRCLPKPNAKWCIFKALCRMQVVSRESNRSVVEAAWMGKLFLCQTGYPHHHCVAHIIGRAVNHFGIDAPLLLEKFQAHSKCLFVAGFVKMMAAHGRVARGQSVGCTRRRKKRDRFSRPRIAVL